MLSTAPTLDAATAERIAADHFGFTGRATPLPSERDQNFRVRREDDDQIVLKIANAEESREMLQAQQAALAHLADRGLPTPRVVRSVAGETLVDIEHADSAHLAWAISWIEGATLANVRRRSPALLNDFGRQIAALRGGLADFDHPAIHRDFYWDLANARRMISATRPLVAGTTGETIDRLMGQFDSHTRPRLSSLPRSAVHGDLNDHNVLVRPHAEPEISFQRIAGFVDFGDMIHSYSAGDLAIAAAYAMLDGGDPVTTLTQLVAGYNTAAPLTNEEIESLFGLAVARLCASVCIAARQQRENPSNEYLGVSQPAILALLPRLADLSFPVVAALLRHACGRDPVAHASRVAAWLAKAAAGASPVLGLDLHTEPFIPLDLSITSPWLSAETSENAEPLLTRRLFDGMREAGVKVAVGGYGEARLLYLAPAFVGADHDAEPRTVHLGVDLFATAGTPVFAPLAGTVHLAHDNAGPQDYGPMIVLRHATNDGEAFFTLYGHLSRESLRKMKVGRAIAAGEQIATLGAPDVNGGWTPHLHFQVITDLLDLGVDFPGVARASQSDAWLALCPDPNGLLGVPSDRVPARPPAVSTTLAARLEHLPRNLSIAYAKPVRIVRG